MLAAIEWAQRDSRTLVSHHPQPPHSPCFPTTVKSNRQCYSSRTWFVPKPYFEYIACRTRCLNPTNEDTNLHLLSVWRGLPYRGEGPGFPVPLKASQMQVANDKIKLKSLFLFGFFGFFGDPGFVLNSFSAHYATLLCFFFVYRLLLLSPLVCLCRQEQTSTVSEAEGDRGLIFTFSFTMYSSSLVLP